MHNPWNVYLGDCAVVTSYLKDKPLISIKWSPIHVINIFLRAVGQPAFVNNPLLGAIILAGLFLYEVEVGLGCILGGVTATLTDLALSLHPLPDLNAGVASFNGVLVGTVIPILFPVFNHLPRSTEMWLAIFVGAITSAFLARAFGNFLSKFDVPYMALPFNLIAVCVFLTLQPLIFAPESDSVSDMQSEANITLEWDKVGRGIVVSMGQVYAVKELEPSIVINLAVLLSSPLLFLMSTLGATLSTLTSLVFLDPSEYEAVYDGLWGYNGLLSMAAVSCVFFPLTPSSLGAGLVNMAATVFVQRALARNMDTNHLPVFTLPMTLTTLVMLLTSQGRKTRMCGVERQLQRTKEMSYPEKQCWQNIQDSERQEDLDEASPEEKEPTMKVEL